MSIITLCYNSFTDVLKNYGTKVNAHAWPHYSHWHRDICVFLFHIIFTSNSSYLASLDSLWLPKHALHLFVSVGFLHLRWPTPPTLAIKNLAILKTGLRTISFMMPFLILCSQKESLPPLGHLGSLSTLCSFFIPWHLFNALQFTKHFYTHNL